MLFWALRELFDFLCAVMFTIWLELSELLQVIVTVSILLKQVASGALGLTIQAAAIREYKRIQQGNTER